MTPGRSALRRWDALPVEARVSDGELVRQFRLLAWGFPEDAARCLAASQGDTGLFYLLVKTRRYFRCRGRRAVGSLFCKHHLMWARRRGAAAPERAE